MESLKQIKIQGEGEERILQKNSKQRREPKQK